MRILVWPTLAAALVFGGISGAHAQLYGEDSEQNASQPQGENAPSENTGEPPVQGENAPSENTGEPPVAQAPAGGPVDSWDDRKCATALAAVTQEALTCMGDYRKYYREFLKSQAYRRAQTICDPMFEIDYWRERNPGKSDQELGAITTAGYIDCMETTQQQEFEDLVSVGMITFLLKTSDCIANFHARQDEIQTHCQKPPSRAVYCTGRKAVYSACECDLFLQTNCADPKSRRPVILSNIGCQYVIDTTRKCENACYAVGDQAQCRADCAAMSNELMATCFPPGVKSGSAKSKPASPQPGKSKSISAKVSNPTSEKQRSSGAGSATKAAGTRNNLDRFDLGPTFASPGATTSPSGSRATQRGGSSGSSTSTTKTWAPSGAATGGTTTWAPAGAKQ